MARNSDANGIADRVNVPCTPLTDDYYDLDELGMSFHGRSGGQRGRQNLQLEEAHLEDE